MTDSIPSPHEHIVFTEFDEREGVLVDLNAKRYYTLNETATIIWRGLEERSTRAESIREMTDAYCVTPEQAALSLDKLIAALRARKVLVPCGGE